MSYIFIDSYRCIDDNTIEIKDSVVNYISNVLRHGVGDNITLFNDKGQYMGGKIVSIYKNQAVIAVHPLIPPETESPLDITLYQGLLKGEKMDFVIQKASELGVKRIVPIITSRSIPHFTRKTDRFKKIASQACRQCGRVLIPDIIEPLSFDDSLNRDLGTGILFYEGYGSRISLVEPEISKISLFIGPEGGFSIDEIKLAESSGLLITSLGRRILRAETASITALSLIQYLYGDLS